MMRSYIQSVLFALCLAGTLISAPLYAFPTIKLAQAVPNGFRAYASNFSADGRYFSYVYENAASRAYNSTVYRYDTSTGRRQTLIGPRTFDFFYPRSALSPNGRYTAVVGTPCSVKIGNKRACEELLLLDAATSKSKKVLSPIIKAQKGVEPSVPEIIGFTKNSAYLLYAVLAKLNLPGGDADNITYIVAYRISDGAQILISNLGGDRTPQLINDHLIHRTARFITDTEVPFLAHLDGTQTSPPAYDSYISFPLASGDFTALDSYVSKASNGELCAAITPDGLSLVSYLITQLPDDRSGARARFELIEQSLEHPENIHHYGSSLVSRRSLYTCPLRVTENGKYIYGEALDDWHYGSTTLKRKDGFRIERRTGKLIPVTTRGFRDFKARYGPSSVTGSPDGKKFTFNSDWGTLVPNDHTVNDLYISTVP